MCEDEDEKYKMRVSKEELKRLNLLERSRQAKEPVERTDLCRRDEVPTRLHQNMRCMYM